MYNYLMKPFEELLHKIQARIRHWPKILQQIFAIILFLFGMWILLYIGNCVGPSGSYSSAPFRY